MKFLLVSLFLLLSATPSFAEVCDKERPSWIPSDGPVSQFEHLISFLTTPSGVISIVLIIAALFFRNLWLSTFSALMLWMFAAGYLEIWFWWRDPVVLAAYREGCIGAPFLTTVLLISTAVGIVVIARKQTENRSPDG